MISKEQFLELKHLKSLGVPTTTIAKKIGISVPNANKWLRMDEDAFETYLIGNTPYLRVNKDNIASQKVMLNNGARLIGEDETHFLCGSRNSTLYALFYNRGTSLRRGSIVCFLSPVVLGPRHHDSKTPGLPPLFAAAKAFSKRRKGARRSVSL